MLLQVTRNPEHLSMSRDSNSTKQIRLGGGEVHQEGLIHEGHRDACAIGLSDWYWSAFELCERQITFDISDRFEPHLALFSEIASDHSR